jgi:hypothetical protein
VHARRTRHGGAGAVAPPCPITWIATRSMTVCGRVATRSGQEPSGGGGRRPHSLTSASTCQRWDVLLLSEGLGPTPPTQVNEHREALAEEQSGAVGTRFCCLEL